MSQTSLEQDLGRLKAIYDRVRRRVGEPTNAKPVVVYISGCWDLFHIGHLNVLERAASLGDFLVVSVATGSYLRTYKGGEIIPLDQRKRIIGALRCVDAVETWEMDDFSIFDKYNVTIWVIGSERVMYEFEERMNREMERRGIKCVVLPRTPNISTVLLREKIMSCGEAV